MNRVTVSAVAAAAATVAAAATILPATAAPRPTAAHLAAYTKTVAAHAGTAHAGTAKTQAAAVRHAEDPTYPPTNIDSEMDGGKYVTVVHCQGVDSPPPIHLAAPGTPLTVSGTGPSAAAAAMLKRQGPYKTIYTCTVLVEERTPTKPRVATPSTVTAHKNHTPGCAIAVGGGTSGSLGTKSTKCTKKVTLNTGFGGLASQVKNHHPAS